MVKIEKEIAAGAVAVVEGVGDHGCEYMTGGRVVVLGRTGRNFGAGMSGGVAYVYDPDGTFPTRVNHEMVSIAALDDADRSELEGLVRRHRSETDSTVAGALLDDWATAVEQFRKVMPNDYQRVLDATARAEAEGGDVVEAIMAAIPTAPSEYAFAAKNSFHEWHVQTGFNTPEAAARSAAATTASECGARVVREVSTAPRRLRPRGLRGDRPARHEHGRGCRNAPHELRANPFGIGAGFGQPAPVTAPVDHASHSLPKRLASYIIKHLWQHSESATH